MAHAETPVAKDLLTQDQIGTFIAAIMDGKGRYAAASEIGQTGTLMRALCRKERDPEFAAMYEEATKIAAEKYQEQLRGAAKERALEVSDRMLEVELATHVPDYRHLRRDRVTHEGKVEHGITISVDPELLSAETVQALRDAAQRAHDEIEIAEIREIAS